MAEWIEANPELSVAIFCAAINVVVIPLLVKWGVIQKGRGDELTQSIEDLKPKLEKALKDQPKDGKIDVAALASSVIKDTVRERALARGVNVAMAIADGAAKVDPDPTKKPRPILRFLGGLVAARLGVK
mgnify:CR=1 FL=1